MQKIFCKVIKKCIILIILFTMTTTDLFLIGNQIVIASENELEMQNTKTSEDNIEFDAYFNNNNNIVHAKQCKIDEKETLFIKINVNDKVSISNAKISIENSNFEIDKDEIKENKYIQSINKENSEIEILSISSNSNVILEIPIKFKKIEEVNEEYFNKAQTIKINGTFKNINEQENNFKSEIQTQIDWKQENIEIELSQEIEKYFSIQNSKIVLQQRITTKVKDNKLPEKEENVNTYAPTIDNQKPEEIKVLLNDNELSNNDFTYNKDTGLISINIKQYNENGNTKWENEENNYKIIYIYNSKIGTNERKIKLKTQIETSVYTMQDKIKNSKEEEVSIQEKGNIIEIKQQITGELYKGYMYAHLSNTTQYQELNTINISDVSNIENIEIDTDQEVYTDNQANNYQANQDITYKQTIINKNEFKNILGETWTLKIKDEQGEELGSINQDTKADVNGNISIEYESGRKNIKMEMTKPKKIGSLSIQNKKEITGESIYNKDYIKKFEQMQNFPIIKTGNIEQKGNSKIELKETRTEAKLEINKNEISTIDNKSNEEIKITLNSNSPEYDLYKNPDIQLIFPKDIKKINVNSINILYGDEYTKIIPTQKELDNMQMIEIKLEGTQTNYKEKSIEGTSIVINVDMELDNKTTSKKDNITMFYTNENANLYKDNQTTGKELKEIEIMSPKGLITTNNIEQMGIETIGEEKTVTKMLEKSSEAKKIKVESEVINNNEAKITNVKIVGEFGTNGNIIVDGNKKQSNLNNEINTGLSVESTDASKISVYYTENENANDDINNTENGWKTQITNAKNTKKYLINLNDMENSEKIKISYEEKIPENLEYNQQAYIGYNTKYTDSLTGQVKDAQSTIIEAKTGEGPVINVSLSAKVGNSNLDNNEEVKEGEVIRYKITIKNDGTEEQENIKVLENVPDGTILVEPDDDYVYAQSYYKELTDKTKEITIESLKAGDTVEKEYEVRVKKGIEDGSEISTKCNIKYKEVTKDSNEQVNILKT